MLEDKGKDNFFDFIEGEYEFDTNTIPRSSIIRFEGEFKIPEEFDVMFLINEYRFILTSNMDIGTTEDEEIFNTIFGNESTKIPTFINSEYFENRIGFSKVGSNKLLYSLVRFRRL